MSIPVDYVSILGDFQKNLNLGSVVREPDIQFMVWNWMNIDAQSGAITLTSSIDREILDHLEVIIVASDGVHTTEWKKMVPVQDINDNAPIFPTPQFSFDILENAPRGAFVGKIEAR